MWSETLGEGEDAHATMSASGGVQLFGVAKIWDGSVRLTLDGSYILIHSIIHPSPLLPSKPTACGRALGHPSPFWRAPPAPKE